MVRAILNLGYEPRRNQRSVMRIPQQRLNFFPLPHGHGSFRPGRRIGWAGRVRTHAEQQFDPVMVPEARLARLQPRQGVDMRTVRC